MRTFDPPSLTQHVDRLYRAAWALCGSREDAEDLVQETFTRVLGQAQSSHRRRRSVLLDARAAQHVLHEPPHREQTTSGRCIGLEDVDPWWQLVRARASA